MKLLMLKGLPASGKSTYAKELVGEGWVRSNKDDLRLLLHGGKWSKKNEEQVVAVRDAIARAGLAAGRNVVVDDTNYHPSHESDLRKIAKEFGAEFETKEFPTDVEECIERDLKRENSVGEQVIRKMWRQYVAPPRERYLSAGPKAVIFDVDGTLARMDGRGPFEWEEVGNDLPQEEIILLLRMFERERWCILIFSGRDSVCREQTEQWLYRHAIPYDELLMRPQGDNRKDAEVKREFYDSLKQRYDMVYAVDDRPQVCRLWHELGLCLLKVGDPDLEF